jgi:hypothetical protein
MRAWFVLFGIATRPIQTSVSNTDLQCGFTVRVSLSPPSHMPCPCPSHCCLYVLTERTTQIAAVYVDYFCWHVTLFIYIITITLIIIIKKKKKKKTRSKKKWWNESKLKWEAIPDIPPLNPLDDSIGLKSTTRSGSKSRKKQTIEIRNRRKRRREDK